MLVVISLLLLLVFRIHPDVPLTAAWPPLPSQTFHASHTPHSSLPSVPVECMTLMHSTRIDYAFCAAGDSVHPKDAWVKKWMLNISNVLAIDRDSIANDRIFWSISIFNEISVASFDVFEALCNNEHVECPVMNVTEPNVLLVRRAAATDCTTAGEDPSFGYSDYSDYSESCILDCLNNLLRIASINGSSWYTVGTIVRVLVRYSLLESSSPPISTIPWVASPAEIESVVRPVSGCNVSAKTIHVD